MPIPKAIQRVHIERALAAIRETREIPPHRESTKYDLLYKGRRYPPKYVVSVAHRFLTPRGKELRGFRGGFRTNDFLKDRGFEIVTKDGQAITAKAESESVEDDRATEEVMPHRRFWVVSPNVTNNRKTVSEWRKASVDFEAAFMGYGPDEVNHKQIGYKFAHVISEGDIILIARSHGRQPDVVGFGIVKGKFQRRLRGFAAPRMDKWHGALRRLSPFIPVTDIPPKLPLIRGLAHTAALRQLNPNTDSSHRLICEWMVNQLSENHNAKGSGASTPESPSAQVSLRSLSRNDQLEFKVRTREMVRLARKVEAELVEQYRQWLRNQHRELKIANYRGLECDAFEEERNNLIEAKASTRREYIRMAVGQLLDYAYLGRTQFGNPRLAILLPSRPDVKLLEWLAELKIGVIWKQRRAFVDNANGQFTC